MAFRADNGFTRFMDLVGSGRLEPARSNLYGVEIAIPPVLAANDDNVRRNQRNHYDYVNALADDVTIPGRRITTGQVRSVGAMRRFATDTSFSEMSVSFLLPKDLYHRDMFEKWMNYTASDAENRVTFYSEYTTTVRIKKWEVGSPIVYQGRTNDGDLYSQRLNKADEDGRVTKVPYDPTLKVSTFWDLGMADKTSIWFCQQKGTAIHLIDYFEDSGESLEYYASILQDRGYIYDTHYLPHDANVREIGTGKSRVEIAQSLGLSTSIVPKMSIEDGINAVRMTLSRCYFDFEKTKDGLDALIQYRWAVNDKGESKNRPQHDWTSHSADAFRYLCTGLQETKNWATQINYPKLGIV